MILHGFFKLAVRFKMLGAAVLAKPVRALAVCYRIQPPDERLSRAQLTDMLQSRCKCLGGNVPRSVITAEVPLRKGIHTLHILVIQSLKSAPITRLRP